MDGGGRVAYETRIIEPNLAFGVHFRNWRCVLDDGLMAGADNRT